MRADKSAKNPRSTRAQDQSLSLAPLSFEEALSGLLQVAPPDKDDAPAPEREPEPPAKRQGKHKPKQDKEKGSRYWLPFLMPSDLLGASSR